jgi:hypothetical protein
MTQKVLQSLLFTLISHWENDVIEFNNVSGSCSVYVITL